MKLTLTVVDPPATLGPRASQVWHDEGGLIGRDPSCDWTLPDPETSRRHARVLFRDEAYWIEDLNSVNGVLVEPQLVRVGVERPYRLKDGDVLMIGDFRIRVAIGDERARDSGPVRDPAPAFAKPVDSGRFGGPMPSFAEEVHSVGTRYPKNERPRIPIPEPERFEPIRVPDQHFVPPAIETPEPLSEASDEGLIPNDWLKSRSIIHKPIASPVADPLPPPPPHGVAEADPPVRRPAPAASASADDAGRRLLMAAGIELGSLDGELAEELGRTFRVAIHGMMELLRARTEVKTQFKMEVSRFQARGNNPLKFAATADEVLDEFFVNRNHRDLPAVEAVAAGIDDLKWHQLALMAGTRHAFSEMLRSFDPVVLKERFEEEAGARTGFGWPSGQKPWEQYVAMYEGIRKDTETYFKRVFGEAFVDEYERQVRELEKTFGSSSTEGRRRKAAKPRRPQNEP